MGLDCKRKTRRQRGRPAVKAIRRLGILPLVMALGLFFGCGHIPRIHVVKDSLSPEERLNLGVAYEARGEYEAALEAYEQAARDPRLKGLALLYKGNALFAMGETARAEKEYKMAIKTAPDLVGAYNNLAWLYCIEGRNLSEAEKLAEQAFELTEGRDSNVNDTLSAIRAVLLSPRDESDKTPCAPLESEKSDVQERNKGQQ